MNIKQFDEFVKMWDEEGQPPDVDWLEYAQDFRNQTQTLGAENKALKEMLKKASHFNELSLIESPPAWAKDSPFQKEIDAIKEDNDVQPTS